jgi:hypothetical protein
MKTQPNGEIITRAQFERQRDVVTQEIGSRRIDKRVVLTVGGLATAELPLKAPVAAIPTYEENGDYHMGGLIRLNLEVLADQVVLIGDEGSNRGRLLEDVAQSIKPSVDGSRRYGEDALTYAFIARQNKLESGAMPILPDFFGELCNGKPPKPYWEFEHLRRIPAVREIARSVELLDADSRPKALLLVGDCFTAGAELAKRLGISGRYVGGLPANEDGVPDMSWAYVGDCEGRNVLVLGAAGVHLDTVIHVVGETGTPQSYTLPVL